MILNPLTKSGVARKEAIGSFARLAGVWASMYGLWKMAGVDIETDPRSSKFGRVKVGKTYFDVSAGTAPLITLMSRILTQSEKTETGIKDLNTGKAFAKTSFDVMVNFFTNKSSPGARVLIDLMKGKDFDGKKLSADDPKGLAKYFLKQFIPLIGNDVLDIYKESGGDVGKTFLGGTAAFFGIAPTTYTPFETDWETSESKEMEKFKSQLGEEKFKEANKEYNEAYKKQYDTLIESSEYKQKPDEKKVDAVKDLKSQIKKDIFEKYNFVPVDDWAEKDSKEMTQFKEKFGEEKMKQANEEYNKKLAEKLEKVRNDERYKKMSQEDKNKVISKAKQSVKDEVFKKYRFTPKYKPDTKKTEQIKKILK